MTDHAGKTYGGGKTVKRSPDLGVVVFFLGYTTPVDEVRVTGFGDGVEEVHDVMDPRNARLAPALVPPRPVYRTPPWIQAAIHPQEMRS